MVHLQDSISKHLHHRTLFNMLFNEIFEAHRAQMLSCFSLGACAWLIVQPIFPAFWLFSPLFSITLQMWFGLPHPSIVGLPWCVCTHSINLMGIHLLHYAHGNEHMGTHDAIHNTFVIIMRHCCNLNLGLVTNLNLGLVTKARVCKGAGWKWSPGVTSHAHGSVGGCEGMNPHIPRWAPTLGVGVPMDSWNFREQL
jgi:hypothetical protein